MHFTISDDERQKEAHIYLEPVRIYPDDGERPEDIAFRIARSAILSAPEPFGMGVLSAPKPGESRLGPQDESKLRRRIASEGRLYVDYFKGSMVKLNLTIDNGCVLFDLRFWGQRILDAKDRKEIVRRTILSVEDLLRAVEEASPV